MKATKLLRFVGLFSLSLTALARLTPESFKTVMSDVARKHYFDVCFDHHSTFTACGC
jgi:hypothetical protein